MGKRGWRRGNRASCLPVAPETWKKSCGGRVPFNRWRPKVPQGPECPGLRECHRSARRSAAVVRLALRFARAGKRARPFGPEVPRSSRSVAPLVPWSHGRVRADDCMARGRVRSPPSLRSLGPIANHLQLVRPILAGACLTMGALLPSALTTLTHRHAPPTPRSMLTPLVLSFFSALTGRWPLLLG